MERSFFDLTEPQKSIWLTEHYFENTSIGCIPGMLVIQEEVNFDYLEKAVNLLVKANDNYRTRIALVNNEPKQYFVSYNKFHLEIENVNTLNEAKKLLNHLSQIPFTLYNSPLFRAKLFRLVNGQGGLLFVAHHLIYDAWTAGLLIDNIMHYYTSLKNGTPITLNPMNTTYIDYIQSEKEYNHSQKFEKDKLFWEDTFTDVPNLATIPYFKNTRSTSTMIEDFSPRSVRTQFTIPKDIVNSINVFCRQNKVSIFNFFMAIFSIYIGRISNLDDFVIGTPILNRSTYKEKCTGGMFISTMPLKITIPHSCNFINFVTQISKNTVSSFRHQKYPYQKILEYVRAKDSQIPNLYDILISYQNMRTNTKSSAIPFFSSWEHNGYSADSLDISICDINDSGSFQIEYDYQTDKYGKEDISKIHHRICYMIEQILNRPNIPLENIDILLPREKQEILYKFNDNTVLYPINSTVEVFERRVSENPNQIAIIHKDQQISYYELNKRANQLAHFLLVHGFEPKSIISVCMNKTIDFIITILAIQKMGGCYLPIHPDYPLERIQYILEDSHSKLITDGKKEIKNSINFSEIDFSAESSTNLNIAIDKEEPAYIIYTSGSTGNPKGVIVSHKNLLNFVYSFNDCFIHKFDASDRCLSLTNISFDVSVCEIFTPLIFGSTLVLYAENTLTDITLLGETIQKNKVTFLYIPPNVLLDVYRFLSKGKKVTTIRKLLVGVEPIKKGVLNKYFALNSEMEIINGYGPTETTICATFFPYQKSNDKFNIVPIGKPVNNNSIFILSRCKTIQPVNAIGEIYVCGDNVSKGYLNNPEKTEQYFSSHLLGLNKPAYRTGDMGYWNKDGIITFLGRDDGQIKFRGHRIELGEISNTIKNIDGIENAFTIVKPVNGINSICSYIVSKNKNESYIKEYLRSKLPYYMLPSYIVFVDQLPVTLNGKVNKKALPEIMVKASLVNEHPFTKTQKLLCEIWENILNMDEIGIDSDFFEIGADSLCSIRLATDIYNTFNIKITVKDIFELKTIRNIAEFIDKKADIQPAEVINKAPSADSYPLSSAQKRIFLSSSMSEESTILYNTPGAVLFNSQPDKNKLASCFEKLVERHEAFRTYFVSENGNFVQKIVPHIHFEIEIEKNKEENLNLIYHNFVKPFDLSCPPLLRCKLVEFDNGKSALLLDMHHIISDGASLEIIVKELCALYNDKTLPQLDYTYKDFAVWEQEQIANRKLYLSKKFWVKQFKDNIPVLNMPTNFPRPTTQSFRGEKIHSKIDNKLTYEIYELSKKLNVTPYMLLLATYYVLLSKYTGQDDIVVGSPTIGRNQKEFENIVGMFVNSLPLRSSIDFESSFISFAKHIKELCLKAFEYQNYPFDLLVSHLKLKRDSSRNPIFDTMFVYQNEGNIPITLGDINSTYCNLDTKISKFDFTLEIIPSETNFNLSLEYCTDLYTHEFMDEFAKHYIQLLRNVVKNPKDKIKDLKILTENEIHQILFDFNNTATEYPKDKSIIELFEEQAEKNPNKIAIVFEGKQLTYQELNEKANQLAHYFLQNNMNSNDIIAISINRSLELIISILGVLKIGATYCLIDSSLPSNRIAYLIDSSTAKYLITNQTSFTFHNEITVLNINNIDCSNLTKSNISHSTQEKNDIYSIVFTSGSTGNPKGIMVKKDSMLNLLFSYKFVLNCDQYDNFISICSISFDMFAVELFTPLVFGKKLILASESEMKDPLAICNLIKKYRIDYVLMTPSRMELLLSDQTYSCLDYLKSIQLGGEPLSPVLFNHLRKCTNAKIYNAYGPSETTSCCSIKEILSPEEISIGTPLCNMQIYICDQNMNLCPHYVPGELCIAGAGISYGYINDSIATKNAFIPNPFGTGLLYKTGDIAKYDLKGNIFFIGRNDNQVKVNGIRVELGEIEKQILEMDSITNCAVLFENNHLIAYISSSKKIEVHDFKMGLSNKLPSYMIPSYIIQLDELPISHTGKINRRLLKSYAQNIKISSPIIAPENDMQKLLCSIWEKLLKTPIGIEDNIFDLGADSLMAIKFRMELLAHNIDIPYSYLFKYKTIKELSSAISNKKSTANSNNYDYSSINRTLLKNSLEYINYPIQFSTNNVLLLGGTGFVGIHILADYLKNEHGNIYCIIRRNKLYSARDRFIERLHFYFNDAFDKLIGNRLFIVEGDVTKKNFGLSLQVLESIIKNVSVIVNATANVKHYGDINDFNNINIGCVKEAIHICEAYKKRLIHLSSLSVSGNALLDGGTIPTSSSSSIVFSERDLYIGQNLDNIYVQTKFEAEKIILEHVAVGLDALILRIGNITSRFSDGKFQINPEENAFANRLKSFILLKSIPEYLLNIPLEFTPVDICAHAIVKIINHDLSNISVLHIYNQNHILIKNFIICLNHLGIDIKIISETHFKDLLTSYLTNDKKNEIIASLINDIDANKKLIYESNIKINSDFSVALLDKFGFSWPNIDENYIKKYISYLFDIYFLQ